MTFYTLLLLLADTVVATTLACVIAVGLGFLGLPALYLIERLRGLRTVRQTESPALSGCELPDVLVQLPIFNEPPMVVDGLLDAVAALDWPRSRLHIQLLDDSSPDFAAVTAKSVARLRDMGYLAEQLCRSQRRGFKAGALAAGLEWNNAPYVALLDADFRPPKSWLKIAIAQLEAQPRAAFVQSRCEFLNAGTNWLTRAQSLLFDSHFIMEQGVRSRAGLLFQFNGTGGIWRRQAIDEAGGWAIDSLCEDLDLTIRAALAGWQATFLMHPAVPGLVPDRIRHWRVQQRRWASGFAQIARKLSGPLWRSHLTLGQKLQIGFVVLYQAALPALAIAIPALLLDIALRRGSLPPLGPLFLAVLVLAVAVPLGMTLPPYLELRRGGLIRYLRDVSTLPPLILFLSLANARPVLAAFFGRREAFKRTPKPSL
ncbi:MAG TPA: glycosyltransferase family 2 protein [Rhizomicrobium sp.]|jgi:cellulose synthase/poly-beta-1,6-N-acetylglucosamine synthase-like glycosyltransferase